MSTECHNVKDSNLFKATKALPGDRSSTNEFNQEIFLANKSTCICGKKITSNSLPPFMRTCKPSNHIQENIWITKNVECLGEAKLCTLHLVCFPKNTQIPLRHMTQHYHFQMKNGKRYS